MRRRLPPRLAQGQAGVHAAAAQLLLRGMAPCFPSVDIGADLVTNEGTRLQVKSGYLRQNRYGGSYHFCLNAGPTVYTAGNGYQKGRRSPRTFSEECDFFVLWGIDQNRFWVCPSSLLDGMDSLCIPSVETPRLRINREAIRADREEGMSFRDIADKYRISTKSAWRLISGESFSEKNTRNLRPELVAEIASHENRWELITSYESVMDEAIAVATTTTNR